MYGRTNPVKNRGYKEGRKRERRPKAFEGPQFEVTGTPRSDFGRGARRSRVARLILHRVDAPRRDAASLSSFSANVVMIRRALGAAPTSTNLRVLDFPRPGSYK